MISVTTTKPHTLTLHRHKCVDLPWRTTAWPLSKERTYMPGCACKYQIVKEMIMCNLIPILYKVNQKMSIGHYCIAILTHNHMDFDLAWWSYPFRASMAPSLWHGRCNTLHLLLHYYRGKFGSPRIKSQLFKNCDNCLLNNQGRKQVPLILNIISAAFLQPPYWL